MKGHGLNGTVLLNEIYRPNFLDIEVPHHICSRY